MRTIFVSFVCVVGLLSVSLVGLVVAHQGEEPPKKEFEELTKEEQLYIKQCAACHNWGGTGKGIFRPLIGITDRLEQAQVVAIIKKGREETGMPAFPDLTDPEMEALYTYLSTLKPSNPKQDSEKAEEKPDQGQVRQPLPVSALYWMNKPVTQPVIDAYTLAEEHAALFDELPCFCNCAPLGHNSLLECYRTTHAMSCSLCRLEATRAGRLSKKGESNAQVAQQIVKQFWHRRVKPQ